MLKNPKLWIAVILVFVVGIAVKQLLPFSVEAVKASVAIAPEILFSIAGFPVSPSIITAVIVFIIITVFAVMSTRNMQLVPSGLQNAMEAMLEAIINLFESIAGPMWSKFFTIAATIFILVLVSNIVGLTPGAGSIGFIKVTDNKPPPEGIYVIADAPSFIHVQTLAEFNKNVAQEVQHDVQVEDPHAIEEAHHVALAPILRAPTTDINLPIALALVSVIMTQVYGMRAQGWRYWTKFFSFGRLLKGDIAMGLIDVFVGIVELISEVAKILSFTFRLFGNIFAGEVILLVMAFLFLFLPLPFYALEFFVAFIQAFVFAVLTVAFMRIATAEHGGGGGHEGEAHH